MNQGATRRYGLVDMGTHAIRLLIVETAAQGDPRVLHSERAAVRLGSALFQTGSIPERAMAGAVDVFVRFRDACRDHGVESIRAIATAAAREANNSAELLERIEQSSGVPVEVISGAEEARLLSRAIQTRTDLHDRRALVADVGGGSVELLILEDGQLATSGSFPYGALRLLAVLVASRTPDDPVAARSHLSEFLEQAGRFLGDQAVDAYLVTGGGSTSLADLLRKKGRSRLLHGIESYPTREVSREVEELARMPFEQRLRIPELGDRADTIVAGGMIYVTLAELVEAEDLLVPRVGLQDGLLDELHRGEHA